MTFTPLRSFITGVAAVGLLATFSHADALDKNANLADITSLDTPVELAPAPKIQVDPEQVARLSSDKESLNLPAGGHSHYSLGRPDAHAPIGVMADHSHHQGEWMLSYRFMYMEMDGNRAGDSRLSDAAVRARGYMVVPTKMNMEMHMFGGMYAATDQLTLMVMLPYIRMEMDHEGGMPLGAAKFTTRTEGIGDLKVQGIFKVLEQDREVVLVNAGLSLPTGSINERDQTPMGYAHLPYPMQLGSGTADLIAGATYWQQHDDWSWGAQASGVLRLGRNYHDYSLGDRFSTTAWIGRQIMQGLSGSLRVKYEAWGNVDGRDNSLPAGPAFIVPTQDPDRRGGQRLDLLVGFNCQISEGPLAGHRLAIEAGVPVWQHLEGPQLETDFVVIFGWQYAN